MENALLLWLIVVPAVCVAAMGLFVLAVATKNKQLEKVGVWLLTAVFLGVALLLGWSWLS